MLFVDLDGFKAINDTVGHGAGDHLLAVVASRISACLRPADTVSRLGGDEFAVLLTDPWRTREAVPVAERMITAIEQTITIEGNEVHVSASIGVAGAEKCASATGLLADADIAMYRAKETGRGCVVVFEPRMRAERIASYRLEAELERAIDRNELSVRYQPIVRLADGRPVAVEALSRWHNPQRGPIPPVDLIGIAERTGLIGALGRRVLDESCHRVARWRRAGAPDLSLNLNVSGRQLGPRFVGDVREVLHSSGLPAQALVLEVTESVFMDNYPEMLAGLTELVAIGVRVSIDDFGTGYSSLSALRHFPISQMKIDKSLIDPMVEGSIDLAIVDTIITLGGVLGVETVAEGIERSAQLEQLRALGCGYGQGSLFCRPGTAESIEAYLHGFERDRARPRPGR